MIKASLDISNKKYKKYLLIKTTKFINSNYNLYSKEFRNFFKHIFTAALTTYFEAPGSRLDLFLDKKFLYHYFPGVDNLSGREIYLDLQEGYESYILDIAEYPGFLNSKILMYA